jgi:hypothetical protein
MKICPRTISESTKEVVHQLHLQIANHTSSNEIGIHKGRSATQVNRNNRQRLVHRQYEIACTINSYFLAKRLFE